MSDFRSKSKGVRYNGAKGKVKGLVRVINSVVKHGQVYWEPFVGSAKVIASVTPFAHRYGSDNCWPIIRLLREVQAGWEPPGELSEGTYKLLQSHRGDPEYEQNDPLMGFAGFGCSFGGRYFEGYARDHTHGQNFADNARRALLRQKPFLVGVLLRVRDYRRGPPAFIRPDVIYCDPPYAGTKSVGSKRERFDSAEFWEHAKGWAKESTVLVSEYDCPVPGAKVLWEKEVAKSIRAGTGGDGGAVGDGTRKVEKLFCLSPGVGERVGLGLY